MISVILANYNGELFLKEALQSIINQEFDDYELIVVDDGSTDKSKDIIDEFACRYPEKIKPIFQLENKGQGASFNLGVAESKGDLICFMDSDDLWFPNKLNNVRRFFDLKHNNIAFLQHNLFFIRNGELSGENVRDTLVSGNLYKVAQETRILPVGFIPTSGLTFPREILKKILPIPQEFKICADGFLTRTAFCYGDIASVSQSWGGYRVHSANYTHENPNHNKRAYINNLLIPALNSFYEDNNFNLQFPKNIFILKLLENYLLPPIIPKLYNYLFWKYQERKTSNVI